MIRIATPISTLFDPSTALGAGSTENIIALSDCLECRDRSAASALPRQELFHCEAEIIHAWPEEERARIQNIILRKPDLRLATFHAASCCSAPVLADGVYQSGGVTYQAADMLRYARENAAWLRSFLPSHVRIGIENNNFHPTPAYEHVTDGAFLANLAEENDLCFLFDLSHARVTAHNRGMPYDAYKASLPLDRLTQVHVSRSAVDGNGHAVDAHRAPGPEELAEVQALAAARPSLAYVTIEYYKDAPTLLAVLTEYRHAFPRNHA